MANEMHIPRRVYVPSWTAAERAIQAAVDEVEKMGADVRLTDAIILLGAAKSAVADVVDHAPILRRAVVQCNEDVAALPTIGDLF